MTTAQIAIAWVLGRGADILPLLGARRRNQLSEALASLDIALTDEEKTMIEAAVPPEAVAGDRYPKPQMALLDSERGERPTG